MRVAWLAAAVARFARGEVTPQPIESFSAPATTSLFCHSVIAALTSDEKPGPKRESEHRLQPSLQEGSPLRPKSETLNPRYQEPESSI